METAFFVLLLLLLVVGAVTAVVQAASPEVSTGRRVELGLLAVCLAIAALFLAYIGYWLSHITF